jgi:hypothetical protein
MMTDFGDRFDSYYGAISSNHVYTASKGYYYDDYTGQYNWEPQYSDLEEVVENDEAFLYQDEVSAEMPF